MNSIFILGGSELQIPAIKKAKERNLYVYLIDYNSKAAGIEFADEYLCISTLDKERVLDAAIKYKPSFIITSTSDMPVRTVSWVCEKLGMRTDISYTDAFCATNKEAMRKRMVECGVPCPEFYPISNLEEFIHVAKRMKNKFVVKPSDNAASRGVVLVDQNDTIDLKKIYEYSRKFSRCGDILVEEYMTGPEVSVEAFTVNGITTIVTITDKIVSSAPYFVELGHTEPSRLSQKVITEIKDVACAAIKALNINNGPSHTELKVTPYGVKLVEIAARLGGDYITSKLVPLSTGVDMVECSYEVLFNEPVNCYPKFNKGAAIRFLSSESGILSGINGVENALKLPGVREVKLYKKVGEHVDALESSSDRIGHIIAVGEDADTAASYCDEALSKIHIKVE